MTTNSHEEINSLSWLTGLGRINVSAATRYKDVPIPVATETTTLAPSSSFSHESRMRDQRMVKDRRGKDRRQIEWFNSYWSGDRRGLTDRRVAQRRSR